MKKDDTRKKILVIDDDEEMGVVMRDILEKHAYEVLYAPDGLRAIEKSNNEKVDLILLDIRLPFFSGFWFFNAFRERPQTKNIPVIVVSAFSREEDIQKAREMGASAYLKKPFKPKELLDVVEKAVH